MRFPLSFALLRAPLAVLLCSAPGAQEAAAERAPNIVVILTDDVGYSEYGFQGSTLVPTPHIDSIAANGVRFLQGYVSGAVCSPTRAGLLTGRYQTRFGHEFNGGGAAGTRGTFGLPPGEKTLADRLRAAGYATCAVGKWHLGAGPEYCATARGFDEFYGTIANTTYFQPPYFIDTRVADEPRAVQEPGFYTTTAFGARAVEWIERNAERPFLLYLAFNASHVPLQAPPEYLERFAGLADERQRKLAAIHAATDDAVGRVLTALRTHGLEEHTLLVFLSDNGSPERDARLRGTKGTLLEGGVRVPFCMQWPGKLAPGQVYAPPVIQLDLVPTALAAAGVALDPAFGLDGVDLLPYLSGARAGEPHAALFWRYGEQWAVRQGDWKLVAGRDRAPQLFRLADDPGEERDLLAAEPERGAELLAAWKAWNEDQAEPLWKPERDE